MISKSATRPRLNPAPGEPDSNRNRIAEKGEPFDTRFDYEQLYVDEGIFGRGVSSKLSAIRDAMLAVPPDQMSEKDRTAWKLNLYEFLVLEQATLHLIVPNRKYLRFDSVDEMNFSVGGLSLACKSSIPPLILLNKV